jgi:toxin ParE1/3/4
LAVRIQEAAVLRLDEIDRYGVEKWGEAHAQHYLQELFSAFERCVPTDERRYDRLFSKPVPAEFGVQGFYFRYQQHFVYWRKLANGDVGIVTILRERMHQVARFKADFFGES